MRRPPFGADDFDESSGEMKTASGRYIKIANPQPADIDLNDIAHALARICRFGGHTRTTYTVGEHSIHVAAQLWRSAGDPSLAAAGLLHDASEAYLGDVIRPLKQLLPGYKEIEGRFEGVIAQRFHLVDELADPRVKEADNQILPWEMVMFRDSTIHPAPNPADVAVAFLDAARRYGIT